MKSLSLSQPHLLVTVGIPGSGKSFFAEKFATTFKAPYVKYDTIMDISGHNTTTSDRYVGYVLRELFKTNHTVVFDGPSATKAERTALRDLAAKAGYACLFVWVQTDEATAKNRFIKDSRKNGRHVTPTQFNAVVKEFVPPQANEQSTVVISGKHTYATQAKAVLKSLAATKQTVRAEKLPEPSILTGSKRNIIVR